MRLKKRKQLLLLLLWAIFLFIFIRRSSVLSAKVHIINYAGICHMRMKAYDDAPGNSFQEHQKFVSVNSSTDYTNLYDDKKVYITYNDPSNGGWYFDDYSSWVQPEAFNVWSIRTRWTWFNPNFTSGDWELWYPCSGSA